MKKLFVFLLAAISLVSAFAQGPGLESYTVTPEPWSGDWLPEKSDTMVAGEDFHGFPGPLPKLWYALGLDPRHPSVDFEQKERVKRDSPYWFGTCNGWAAAATQFEEPQPLVINGVKLFGSEVKAILAAIWKDNVELTRGNYDSQGITAKSFEEILYQFIAANEPIIFDVVLGVESWNYPVVGFTRNAVDNGAWVDVDVTVRYANSLNLSLLDRNYDNFRYLDLDYTYRYNSEGTYEWVGASVTERPQRAWVTRVPYILNWYSRGNRHLNMGLYDQLGELDGLDNHLSDRFEPNDQILDAPLMAENLLLASVTAQDTDFFRIPKAAGEAQNFRFRVYDGADVDVTVSDDQGNVLSAYEATCEVQFELDGDYDGFFHVQVSSRGEEVSFYELQHLGNRGYFNVAASSAFAGGVLKAVSIREPVNQVMGDELQSLSQNGMYEVPVIDPGTTYRAGERTLWAAENVDESRVYKVYNEGHLRDTGYVVPHLTCRNGWKTRLKLARTNNDPVSIRVFDLEGNQLASRALPSGDNLDLGQVLSQAAQEGTWFQLETSSLNLLSGFVSYEHDGIGYAADFDISSRPRNGEMVLHNLPLAGQGWVGLAVTNVSGVENPILYRLLDEKGDVVEEGDFVLQPNQKWLGLPQQMVTHAFDEEYTLWMFSMFNVESLALRHDMVNGLDYAHRLFNPTLDFVSETYITPPISGTATSSYLVLNPHTAVNYVRFRGYDAEGNELFEHRLNDAPFRSFDWRYFTLEQLLTEAGQDPLNHEIAHFKVTSSRPLLAYELVGLPGQNQRNVAYLANIFDLP